MNLKNTDPHDNVESTVKKQKIDRQKNKQKPTKHTTKQINNQWFNIPTDQQTNE